jgi:ATP-binding cassette, subfamily B, bacterial
VAVAITNKARRVVTALRVSLSRGDIQRIRGYLLPWWRTCLLLVPVIAVQTVLGLVPVLLFRSLIGGLEHRSISVGHIALYVLIGLAAAVISALFGVVETFLAMRMAFGVVAAVRRQLFECLLSQPLGFFTRTRAGEVTSRLLNDIGAIEAALNDTLVNAIRAGTGIFVSLFLMFVLAWQITLLTLLAFPLLVFGLRWAGGVSFRANMRVQERLADISAYAVETLGISGLMLVKAFGMEAHVRRRFAAANDELQANQVSAAMSMRWFGVGMAVLQLLGPALIVLLGGDLVLHHQLSLATLLTFLVVTSARFAPDLQNALGSAMTLIQSLAAWGRVFTLLDAPPELAESASAAALSRPAGAIELDAVTFAYPGQVRPALGEVSLAIGAGELVALVGPSGAGKSTLSMLIPRFHDPNQGRVKIDGIDVRDITHASLAATIGLVFQDSFLFHASLRENLLVGRPDATDAQITAALAAANLLEVVRDLPAGLDTPVGERGHHLSGGERQRVAIARVILKDPPVLILDEATSHLDSASERLVQDALSHLFRGRTSLVIAHRLSTVLSADRIIVLDGGHIIEQGTHEQLLERAGMYSHLYALQYSRPDANS